MSMSCCDVCDDCDCESACLCINRNKCACLRRLRSCSVGHDLLTWESILQVRNEVKRNYWGKLGWTKVQLLADWKKRNDST